MEIQLEFNYKNESDLDLKLGIMQKQIELMNESVGKVRRKLFAQMGELQKLCMTLQTQNAELQKMVQELRDGKIEWAYMQNGMLFEAREAQVAIC